jgi:hypothetical protein
MVSRNKNLLEAFRNAAPDRPVAGARKVSAGAAGGPFAGGGKGSTAGPVTARLAFADGPRRSLVQRALADRPVQLALLGGAVVLAAVLVLAGERGAGVEAGSAPGAPAPVGAGSFAGTLAGEPTAGAAAGSARPPDPVRRNEVAAQLGTPDDQAFHDLANRFTVRVAQYKNDERGLELAQALVAWLRKEGYPAVRPIRTGDGKALLVCAGAMPEKKDLDTLADFLRKLRGPPPQREKQPFQSAYVDAIDNVLKRR